jgi:uncharacterized Ntn-hydrolase superfamily protein
MTYSIVARDPETGAFGVGVQTHQPSVGAIVPWAKAGVGAVATQSFANINFGPQGLALLESGLPAGRVLAALVAADTMEERRQVAVIDETGTAAVHTGRECIPFAGHDRYGLLDTGEHDGARRRPRRRSLLRTSPAATRIMMSGRTAAGGDIRQPVGGDPYGTQAPGATWDLRIDNSRDPLGTCRRC